MPIKTGLAYFDQHLNSNKSLSDLLSRIESLELKMVYARVTDIILDESHPKFSEYGEWNGIGVIEWEVINNQSPKSNIKPFAKPFFPQFKTYPLVNELIILIKSPDTNIGLQDTSEAYYYLNTISLWNHPHHNAYPNIFDGVEDEKQKTDYHFLDLDSKRKPAIRRLFPKGLECILGKCTVLIASKLR